jgi:hypothetical protein
MGFKVGVQGFFKLTASRVVDGERVTRIVADWFPNLITNGGLNRMATSSYLLSCQVGSGSTVPAFTDTSLTSFVAGSSTIQTTNGSVLATSPYYAWIRRSWRFAEGAATGNLSEVGIAWTSTPGNLFSHALILDEVGSPTTITILSDESLDVIYELRYYPKLTDTFGTVVLTGSIGGSYDWTMRTALAGTYTPNTGWGIFNSPSALAMNYSGPSFPSCYFGGIGAITAGPSSSIGTVGFTPISYVSDSFEISVSITFSLLQGNHASGIRAVLFKLGVGAMQIEFDPPIPKTAADLLSLVVKYSYARV